MSPEVKNGEKGELLTGLACKICQRQCKHFHYLKGHMCMHYRNKLKEKVADWGGGLGGSGFACRLCEFVTLTKDSLVTHAGYKHALFVQFMPENIQKDFLEVAKSCGENTESWDLGNNESRGDNDQKEKEEENEKEENVFDNQLTLPSQMTNINCKLATPNPTKCLECDFQVGSVLQYKCHLLVHYQSQVEKDVEDLFKEVKGLCKECNDLRPMDFADFTRHFALDHDRIYNVVSAQVKNHLTIAFPGSDVIMSKPDEDTKENSIANDTFEENIQIEIEPVDDKEEEIDQEDNLKNESLKPAENSVDVN
eukprot:06668.XXX_225544_223765_1 [CDS] Oithona nana genome sequencing.